MTRQDIKGEFTVKDGIIQDCGKFEGEMLYVPYFWEFYLNGFADRDDDKILGFDLDTNDKIQFPELKGRRTVKLMETDMGFVIEV